MIYIDEVQDYLRLPTDLGDALATARSLGAGFHLAHQYEKQLPPAMADAFRNNARSRICFQLQAGDAKEMTAGQSVLSVEDFTTTARPSRLRQSGPRQRGPALGVGRHQTSAGTHEQSRTKSGDSAASATASRAEIEAGSPNS